MQRCSDVVHQDLLRNFIQCAAIRIESILHVGVIPCRLIEIRLNISLLHEVGSTTCPIFGSIGQLDQSDSQRNEMQYFPLFLDLKNKPVLVVGGGEVASRKVDSLVRSGANVTIVSPKIEPYLQRLIDQEECHWIQSFYSSELLNDAYIQVWATTDNPDLNHQVHKDAKAKNILVNVVDDKPYCDFITPSIINRGRIQIAISSGGASPVLVRNIRQMLETNLAQNLSLQADFASSKRNDIKQRLANVDERRKFWESFFSLKDVELATSITDLECAYQAQFANGYENSGSVTWIEYGDDPELLPLKALRIMQQAEVVYSDANCPFVFTDLIRRDAERKPYSDESDLSVHLGKEVAEGNRVVVFVAPNRAQYKLLRGNDILITLAGEET